MTFAQVGRWLLALAALLIVVWAFIDVGWRSLQDPRAGRETLLRVLYWGNIAEDAIVRDLVAEFERRNPTVRVLPIHTSDFDQKLKTMIAAGDAPDLFYFPAEYLTSLGGQGLVEPLDDFVAGDDTLDLDAFYPQLVDAFRLDRDRDGRRQLFALPKDFTTIGMYVNVGLFERAGVAVPYDGWTWDDLEDAARRITDLGGPEGRVFGIHFNHWPAVFKAFAWGFGGGLFEGELDGTPDYTRPRFTDARTVEALEFMRRLRRDEGVAFNATGIGRDGGNEFVTGNIGMIGPVGRWMTSTYRAAPGLDFDFVPLPTAPGVERRALIITVGWAMSSAGQNKAEAFELMKFLCGPEGVEKQSRLGLAIPPLREVAESDAFLDPSRPPRNARAFLDLIENGVVHREPDQREIAQILEQQVSAAGQLGTRPPGVAMATAERQWLAVLDSPLKTEAFPQVRWGPILLVAGAVLASGAGVLTYFARRERLGAIDRRQERAGFLFISPWLIGFACLTLGPMVLSLVLAFTRWSAMTPVTRAEFVGWENFRFLFTKDDTFTQSLWVTAYYVVLAVPITQVAALAVALLMASGARGIGVFRTIYFLPSVITGVAMGTLWLALFNNDFGLINEVLRPVLGVVGLSPPDWFGVDATYAAIPAFVLMSVWGVGGAMVIYLAGIKNIPVSLYEAGMIDGTGPWHRFWNITLPMLSPLVFFNLVMGIIGSFQVFTQAFVMTGRGPDNSTLFYVLNLYYQAFEAHNMGYASAMAWVLFLIVLGLTLLVFRISRNLIHYEGLR